MLSRAKRLIVWLIRPCVEHWLLFGALLMATVEFGVFSQPRDSFMGSCEHGWPLVYMDGYGCQDRLWIRGSDHRNFSPQSLAVNILTAVSISFAFVLVWRRHLMLNSRPWQFRLKEVAAIALLTCLALGVFVGTRRSYRADARILGQMSADGWVFHNDIDSPAWVQPLADVGLLDEDDWRSFCLSWGVIKSHAGNDSAVNDSLARHASAGHRLRRTDYVIFVNAQLTDEGIAALCRLVPDCKVLALINSEQVTDAGLDEIVSHMHKLKEVTFHDTGITD